MDHYNKLKEYGHTVKYCHILAIMGYPVEIEWTKDLGVTQQLVENTTYLKVGTDVLQVVQEYSAKRELGFDFDNTSQILYRLSVAINSQVSTLLSESKVVIPHNPMFGYSIESVGKYYPYLSAIMEQAKGIE